MSPFGNPLDCISFEIFRKFRLAHADLISYVRDRLGRDRRYAIDFSRIGQELGWQPKYNFEQGLGATIGWYLEDAQIG